LDDAAKELVRLWRLERESEELSDLPADAVEKIRLALKKVRESNYGRDRSGIFWRLKASEMDIVRFIASDIVYCRGLKTLLGRTQDAKVYGAPDHHLLVPVSETKKIVTSILESLERGHTAAVQTPFRAWAAEEIVMVTSPKVDQFVDEWGKKHGPYFEKELVVLPKKYAEILISQSLVSRISPQ